MSKSSLRIGVTSVVLLSTPCLVEAQTCLGLADQRIVSQSLAGAAGASGELRRLVGQYTLSGEHVFGGLSGSYIATEQRTAPGAVVGAELGYTTALPGGFSVCPRAQLNWHSARGGMADFSTASLGLALGRAIPIVGAFSIVPSLQGGIANRSGGPIGTFNVTATTKLPPNNRTFGEMGVGLGFRFGDLLTVRPSYARPFGLGAGVNGGYDETYSLSISVGRKRR
ncbi:autotransporter domain-containing protein [Gemmatimonas groenlandica]|uniref:Autotransporter domain-containing protein n=1 Tax=Gemmatimonas groenlandica TaxID=2732249 RepID=A0A6M4IL37_9BACT|nr:autotransporter domain-containing protein [Gemmatimonas groenlandica]QJR35360.1 autotransporter domain-containing protein [Gemmatimonas groenlandica]